MKKGISLLLLIVVLLAPCVYGLEVRAEEEDLTEIVFWHSMQENAGTLLEELVEEYNEGQGKEAKVKVTAVFQGKYQESVTKMNSALTSDDVANLPDVMNLDATGKLSYFSSDYAYTVDEALADHEEDSLDDLLAVALQNWSYSDTQLGLPFATSTTITYYNKTICEEAGFEEAPKTFADIIELSKKLPKETEDGLAIIAFQGLPGTPVLANYLGQLESYLVNHKNGTEGSAEELVCIENDALKNFLTEWKALYTAGALENVSADIDAFVAGQVAVFTGSSSGIEGLREKIGDKFELGVSPYITINEEARPGASVSGSCVVMFDRGEDAQKEAAWNFVKYLASAEVQAKFAAGTGYVPANTKSIEVEDYAKLLEDVPHFKVPVDQLKDTPEDMRSVTVGPAIDFYYAIQNNISDMLENDMSPEEVVEAMAEELNGLLEQYNKSNE